METWHFRYTPSEQDLWQGRTGEEPRSRIYQAIECVDLPKARSLTPAFGFLGFSCDEGVRRNQGFTGAREGPNALKRSLARLPLHTSVPLYDFGNIVCEDENLEASQIALSQAVAILHRNNIIPIILGGGHEVAWGHFQGITKAFPKENFGVVNFDAHFDLRSLDADGNGSSGTSFLQMAEYRKKEARPFDYLCLGLQPFANTRELFHVAENRNVHYVSARHMDEAEKALETFLTKHSSVYLTICMDVFAAAFAPGVSAPQPLGLFPEQVLSLLERASQSGKIVGLDIAELCPARDVHRMTADLGASLIATFLGNFPVGRFVKT